MGNKISQAKAKSEHAGMSSEEFQKRLDNKEACPVRQSLDVEPASGWRNGDPRKNYEAVNNKYLLQKVSENANGSLEKVVENLVKSWEAEASHKINPKDWVTIDYDNWYIQGNGGFKCDAAKNVQIGNYNALMNDVPKELYDHQMSWEESHEYFREHFKTGFAWEVLKVFTGPPKVAFEWRHWGHLGTKSLEEEASGQGKIVDLRGFTVAYVTTIDGDLKLQGVENFFDAVKFLEEVKKFNTADNKAQDRGGKKKAYE